MSTTTDIRYSLPTGTWRLDPVHPSEKNPYTICLTLPTDRSRSVARSGIIPTYQKNSDTVAYVDTANTSHSSGLRNCGHIDI